MRIIPLLTLLAACSDPDFGGPSKSDTTSQDDYTTHTDTDTDADSTGTSGGSASTWVELTGGYFMVSFMSMDSSEDRDAEFYNVNVGDFQFVGGNVGELLEVVSDAYVNPRYTDPPGVRIDPESCPMVYCNPWGDTNKPGGELDEETCGTDVYVYVYPPGYYQGDLSECGPWDLY